MKYIVELTESQLDAISHACETCARLDMLQLDMVAGHIGDGIASKQYCDIREILEDATKEIRKIHTVTGRSEESKTLWDIYQSARYILAWDRLRSECKDAPLYWSVDYGEPLKTSKEPLPIVKQVI